MGSVDGDIDYLSHLQITEDERLFYGINNLALDSLGVALLQIKRWTKLKPGDITTVRRMTLRASPLGPCYHDITKRCLHCDFGYGKDLTKPRLK